MNTLGKGAALASAGLLAIAVAHAGEQTVNVSATVNIEAIDVVISGVEDLQINVTEAPQAIGSGQTPATAVSTFCLFSPTQFFSMTISGSNPGTGGDYVLVDALPERAALASLRYTVGVADIFSDPGNPVPLGGAGSSFQNGVARTGLDSDPFISDATCTDGENLALFVSVPYDLENNLVLEAIADGLPHTFTDTLTIVVAPDL
jgi:hypothetical protein